MKNLILQNEIQNRIEQLRKELSVDESEIIIALTASLAHYQQMQLMRFSYEEYFKEKEESEKKEEKGDVMDADKFLEFVKQNNMGENLDDTKEKED